MDEYEVGKVYRFGGVPYRYEGGDPKKRSSWVEVGKELAPLPGDPTAEMPQESTSAASVGALRGTRPYDTDALGPLDLVRLLSQGATLGFGDEIAGLVHGGDVGQAEREAANEARRRAGLLGPVIEGAPMMAAPLMAGAGRVLAGRGLFSAMGRGAATGAAEGAAYGLGTGEGDLGDRAGQAVLPTLFGLGAGGLAAAAPPVANAMRRGRAGRAGRIADAFGAAAGNPTEYSRAANALQEYAENVRVHFYGPLEEAHQTITDPAFLDYIRSPEIKPYTARVNRRVAEGVVDPSFREAQRIKSAIKSNIPEALDEFMEIGNRAVPGWRLADKNYGKALGQIEAMDAGRQHWQATKAADAEVLTKGMSQQELDAFRIGQAQEIMSRLGRRELGQIQPLTDFMDIGPETERLLRGIFPTDEGWSAFQRAVNVEKSAEGIRRVIRRFAPWLVGAGAGLLGWRLGRGAGGGGGAGIPTGGGQ